MKISVFVALACFSVCGSSIWALVPQDHDTAADAAWEELMRWRPYGKSRSPLDGLTSAEANRKWPQGSVDRWKWLTRLYNNGRRYREAGLAFWKEFPHDPRRIQWFEDVAIDRLHCFWTNPEEAAKMALGRTMPVRPPEHLIDLQPHAAWQREFLVLRAEYMALPDEIAKNKQSLRQELVVRMITYSSDDPVSRLMRVAACALDYMFLPQVNGDPMVSQHVFDIINADADSEDAFLRALAFIPNEAFQKYVAGRSNISNYRKVPVKLELPDLEGGTLNLESYRGKVVLVDVWSNYCESCINSMPRLQKLLERYSGDGFEIVGIWVDGNLRREGPEVAMQTARGHLKKQGARWRNGVVGIAARHAWEERYAVQGYPMWWLLDRDGRLISSSYLEMAFGNSLESMIQKALGVRASEGDPWGRASNP